MLAQKYSDGIADYAATVSSAASAAAATASATVTSGIYAVQDSLNLPYDYLTSQYDDARSWVVSTWDEGQLRQWAQEHNLVKSPAEAKKDELLAAVTNAYNDAADNAYETWSDSKLRSWLSKHGVVKSKTASTRDELLALMSSNYYGAKDTTYQLWNESQLRRWLQSRGVIETDAQKTKNECVCPRLSGMSRWLTGVLQALGPYGAELLVFARPRFLQLGQCYPAQLPQDEAQRTD